MANFDASPVLGTPLSNPMPSAAGLIVKDSLSQEIFDNSLKFVESVNESNIIFRRQPSMLQGMSVSRVQTGGFPSAKPSIVVGADQDGINFNTRLPALFTQPSPDKRVSVGSMLTLTGENGGEPLFRNASDSAVRQKRGSMTVRRFEQEAAIARKKQRASLENIMADDGDDTPSLQVPATQTPVSISTPTPKATRTLTSEKQGDRPSVQVSTPRTVLAQVPNHAVNHSSTSRSMQERILDTSDASQAPVPLCQQDVRTGRQKDKNESESPKLALQSMLHALKASARRLHANSQDVVTGQLSVQEYFQRFVNEQHWILVGVSLTAICVLGLLIVAIVMAARRRVPSQTP